MDKRLAKRHKRQVSRAKDRVRLSEPDVRTPEQIQAAREASRTVNRASGSKAAGPATVLRGNRAAVAGTPAEAEA